MASPTVELLKTKPEDGLFFLVPNVFSKRFELVHISTLHMDPVVLDYVVGQFVEMVKTQLGIDVGCLRLWVHPITFKLYGTVTKISTMFERISSAAILRIIDSMLVAIVKCDSCGVTIGYEIVRFEKSRPEGLALEAYQLSIAKFMPYTKHDLLHKFHCHQCVDKKWRKEDA